MNVNPGFFISQENGDSAVSSPGAFAADQFALAKSGIAGTCTLQRGTETAVGGLPHRTRLSMPVEATGAADFALAYSDIEGQRMRRLGWNFGGGTMTFAALVRSNVGGTKSVAFERSDSGASYVHEFDLTADEVSFVYHLVPAPAANGAWTADNSRAMRVSFVGRAGGDHAASAADAWEASGNLVGPNHDNNDGSAEDFDVIAWALLPGVVPVTAADMPYLARSEGEELALCQRYLPVFAFADTDPMGVAQAVASSVAYLDMPIRVRPRVAPTGISVSGAGSVKCADAGYSGSATFTPGFARGGLHDIRIVLTSGSGLVAGNASLAFASGGGKTIVCTGCRL
jgi:hypothetical protein